MLPPFGFSVGDFVSGIYLIRELIKALEDSAGASAEFRSLIKELYSLERALLEVKHLDLEESQRPQHIALQQAAAQCQQTIDEFLQKIRKFQPALQTGGSSAKWRDGLRKIEWALYKREDVEKFRAQLSGNTASINMLLMTVQIQASKIQAQRLESQQSKRVSENEATLQANRSIEANNQLLKTNNDLILALAGVATNCATQEQNNDMKDLMLKILNSNIQMYDIILNMQMNLPQQIERQRPVLFLDACGRLSPVHLEFITSADAFLAVLKDRFKDGGLQRIERGQFVLEDARAKRVIDLKQPWNTCFLPGQKIDMSMIFLRASTSKTTCPACHHKNTTASTGPVECPNCGMHYCRIIDLDTSGTSPSTLSHLQNAQPRISHAVQGLGKRKRHDTSDDEVDSDSEDEIHKFRRVQIKARKGVEWSELNKHPSIVIRGRGLELSLVYNELLPMDLAAVATYANRPLDNDFTYFELTVISSGRSNEGAGLIEIGLSSSNSSFSISGVDCNSWHFNSRDGFAYGGVGSNKTRMRFGHPWATKDTVGCGWYSYENSIKDVYFTQNGEWLGVAFSAIPAGTFYPTVTIGLGSIDVRIRANFGQRPFRFNRQWSLGRSQFPLLAIKSSPSALGSGRYDLDDASQGDAVLIGFLGWLNHADLASRASEDPLPQSDDSDVDATMEVGNESTYKKLKES